MKLITKKKALKLVGLQVALLIALLITQIGIQFAQSYKWIGFEKKDQSSWVGIAETAQADKMSCQDELAQVKAEKDQAIEAGNQDILK